MDVRELPEHGRGDKSHWAVEALLEECAGSCPAFVDKAIKDGTRETGPDVLSPFPPVLLEEGAKVRLAEPEDAEVGLVLERVLGESDPVQVL
jgi:hypothetical protein